MSWCSSPQAIDGKIEPLYSEEGRPGWTRFVIGLLLLKHIFALSDEDVCEAYDPYFQYSATGRSDALLSAAIPHRSLSSTVAVSPRYAHWRGTKSVSRRLTYRAESSFLESFLDGGHFYDEPCLPGALSFGCRLVGRWVTRKTGLPRLEALVNSAETQCCSFLCIAAPKMANQHGNQEAGECQNC